MLPQGKSTCPATIASLMMRYFPGAFHAVRKRSLPGILTALSGATRKRTPPETTHGVPDLRRARVLQKYAWCSAQCVQREGAIVPQLLRQQSG